MGMPEAGDIAPDVALPDHTNEFHRLADQRGRWVVLYFYPEDDTPGCTIEACGFRDANDELAAEGAVVWGVSPQGADSKRRFREKSGLDFPLLADEGHHLADTYGTWVEKNKFGRTYWGVQRATFLVDPEGRIARTWPTVKPDGHPAEVLAAIREEKQAARAG